MTVTVDWLPALAYGYLLVFARVGTLLMLLPGLGTTTIPARMRLSFALLLSLVFYPLVKDKLPDMPNALIALSIPLGHELLVGFILGGILRMILAAVETAGATIAFQTGLSFANAADPTLSGQQSAIVSNFLSLLAVALIFVSDLHHMALAAIYHSYVVFPPTQSLMFADAVKAAFDGVASAFALGVQMSAPFIVFGLIFYMGLGILSRLMPQMQVFFIAMPANIFVGLFLIAILTSLMMGWYLTHYQAQLAMFTR